MEQYEKILESGVTLSARGLLHKILPSFLCGTTTYILAKHTCLFPLNCLVPKQLKNYYGFLFFFFAFFVILSNCFFFFFLYFVLKKGNTNSIKLINDFKMNMLKIERVECRFF